jgi:hypothetical protein
MNQSITLQLQPEKIHIINQQGNTGYAHDAYWSSTLDILSIFLDLSVVRSMPAIWF